MRKEEGKRDEGREKRLNHFLEEEKNGRKDESPKTNTMIILYVLTIDKEKRGRRKTRGTRCD